MLSNSIRAGLCVASGRCFSAPPGDNPAGGSAMAEHKIRRSLLKQKSEQRGPLRWRYARIGRVQRRIWKLREDLACGRSNVNAAAREAP